MYYRDLGVKYYVPYDYIDRTFTRISECQPDDSPAYYYYRLILVHDGKEFANLIFNKEEDVDHIHAERKRSIPTSPTGTSRPPTASEADYHKKSPCSFEDAWRFYYLFICF